MKGFRNARVYVEGKGIITAKVVVEKAYINVLINICLKKGSVRMLL